MSLSSTHETVAVSTESPSSSPDSSLIIPTSELEKITTDFDDLLDEENDEETTNDEETDDENQTKDEIFYTLGHDMDYHHQLTTTTPKKNNSSSEIFQTTRTFEEEMFPLPSARGGSRQETPDCCSSRTGVVYVESTETVESGVQIDVRHSCSTPEECVIL